MKEWWDKKKSRTRKSKKSGKYNALDFLLDAIIWIPELIFFPLRLAFWLLRGLGRFFWDLF